MVHTYLLDGYRFAVDGNSGSIHLLDEITYDLINDEGNMPTIQSTCKKLEAKYTHEEIDEAYREVKALCEEGMLFTSEDNLLKAAETKRILPAVKSLCLHVAHDCNLCCDYCFASEGDYNSGRKLMTKDVAFKAVDFLIKGSLDRHNIEIDFFGGEPLMNFDVVRETVSYRKGYNTGILDADITGPSIPKMFGIKSRAIATDAGIFPEFTTNKIRIMSINLLLEQEDLPVVWRGPLLGGTVKQFWTDVVWGNLDYLFIDMPPGTGDVPLTVFQSIPLDGIVIVTSPQKLVSMIVKKAYNMAKQMNVPVLGVVENMSYVKCPDCGKEIKLFGQSKLSEIAGELNLEIFGRVLIDPVMAELADKGQFDRFSNDSLKNAEKVIERML